MFEKKVQPGDHVIDQGDDGDNFYVIDKYVWHFVECLEVVNCLGNYSLNKLPKHLKFTIYKPLQSLPISTFLDPVCVTVIFLNYFFLLKQ